MREPISHDAGPPSIALSMDVWKTAYIKYRRFWTNLAKTTHISDDEAEDVVHAVLSSMMEHTPTQFQSLEHLRNYVAKSVLNKAIQDKRKRNKSAGWSESLEAEFSICVEQADPAVVEQQVAFREAVARLPDRDFEIIKLRFYSGLRFAEISEMLGVPISTLKSREDAALRRIRKRMRRRGFEL
jgi:RNA polymerase sigma-70 factor (ECF subfamily)